MCAIVATRLARCYSTLVGHIAGSSNVGRTMMGSRVFRQLGGQCRIRTGLRIPSLSQPRSRGAFFRLPASPMELSAASNPSVIAHARNDRAAIDALASSDASCRRRTRRLRGPTNVRAKSAASSSVRTVTSRARRRGGSNTKFVHGTEKELPILLRWRLSYLSAADFGANNNV
jgi:hypothetical protein